MLALFLLPFFGARSDKTNTKIGKRMPYILFGTGCAVILMNLLPLMDNSYAAAPSGFKTASFVIVLGLLLIAMGTYRSAAVALMPDLTPKPLRSRANAIINLMGAVGGIFVSRSRRRSVLAEAAGRHGADQSGPAGLSAAFPDRLGNHVCLGRHSVPHDQRAASGKGKPEAGSAAPGVEPCRDRRYRNRGPSEARPAQPQVSSCIDCPVVHGL